MADRNVRPTEYKGFFAVIPSAGSGQALNEVKGLSPHEARSVKRFFARAQKDKQLYVRG